MAANGKQDSDKQHSANAGCSSTIHPQHGPQRMQVGQIRMDSLPNRPALCACLQRMMAPTAGTGSEAASPWQHDSGSLTSNRESADGRSRRSSRAPSPIITTQFSAAAVATARGPRAAQDPTSLAPAAAVGASSSGAQTQPASSQQASLRQHGSTQRPGQVPMQLAEQHESADFRLEACGSGSGSGALGGTLAGSDSLLPAASTLVPLAFPAASAAPGLGGTPSAGRAGDRPLACAALTPTPQQTPPGQLRLPLGVQQRTPALSSWGQQQQQQSTPASGAVAAAWQRRQLGTGTPVSSAAATP